MLIMCTDFQPYMSNQTIEKVCGGGGGWWALDGGQTQFQCSALIQTFELKT